MSVTNSILLTLSLVLSLGCATSFKSQTYRNMIIGSAVGGVYGNSLEQHKTTHSAMYAGIGATIAAIASIVVYDPDAKIEELKKQNIELSKSIADGKKLFEPESKKSGGLIQNYNQIPKEYRSRINAGQWKLSEIDEVEQIDENTLVRKTEVLEIIPPEIKN